MENTIYKYKKIKIYYDNKIWTPVENYMGSTVTFFLTEEEKKKNNLQNFQPCINFIIYENIRINMNAIYKNTCNELKQYMKRLNITERTIRDEICDFVYKGESTEKLITCRQIIKKDNNDVMSVTGGCDSEIFGVFEEAIRKFLDGVYYEEIPLLKWSAM